MKKLVLAVLVLRGLLNCGDADAATLEELLVQKGVISRKEVRTVNAAAPARMYWNNGTRFEFPESGFTSGFYLLLRERYTFTDNENGTDTSSFEQKNARLYVSGTALNNEFSYLMMADMVGDNVNGKSSPTLKDAWVQWNSGRGIDLRMGQYHTFVSRQFNTSLARLQFPDFAAATNYFLQGRQPGASASYRSEDKRLTLRAGIFNGGSDNEGENRPGVDTRHTGIVTARFNIGGEIDPFEEGDVSHTPEPALSVGATYAYGKANNDFGSGVESVTGQTVNPDVTFKYRGFSLAGEYYYRSLDSDSADASPSGYYVQAGYLIPPYKVEPVVRYSYLDCDGGRLASGSCKSTSSVDEISVGMNYYFWKNNLKATLAYVSQKQSTLTEANVDTSQWMFQMSSLL